MKTETLPTSLNPGLTLPSTSTLTLGNIIFILVGLVFLGIGLHRIMPIRFWTKGFFLNNGVLAVMLPIAFYFIWKRHVPGSFHNWGIGAARFGGNFLCMMVLLCIVMASSGVIMNLYKEEISNFLLKHHILAPAVGTFLVPTPNAAIGIIEAMWHEKILQPSFICFIQAASLASFPLFLLRQMGFKNTEICAKMYIFGLIASIAMFVFMKPLYGLTVMIYEAGVKLMG